MSFLRSLILVGLCLFQAAMAYAQCNHRHGFSHSPLSDSLDAVHYRIHLQEINFEQKTILAHTQIQLLPKMDLNSISLELKALTVDSAKLNGEMANVVQQGDMVHFSNGNTFAVADTVAVDVYYQGTPFHEQWGGFHFSGNYAFNLGVGFVSDPHNLGKAWFPCVDDFQDRATYEVLITLPADLTGIAGGLLVDTTHHEEMITWHWKLDQPIPTYLASVAAGNYALTASDYQGMQEQLPITIYTRPADTNKVAGSFLHLPEILTIFENRYGPYPFDRIGYTGTAIGAMEHVTNIAYPHSAINGNLGSEYLLAHELSHMWFGNQVTCAIAEEMWLNEGWATFCHHFFKHDLYSPEVYLAEMYETHYDVIRNAHISDGGYYALNNVPTSHTYGTTVYDKGATVVHTLMYYMGQELFFETVKAYLEAYRFQHASSVDMMNFFTTHSGMNLNDFFEAWVFTPGTPHFAIDSVRSVQQGAIWYNNIYFRQKFKGADFLANSNRFEVALLDANWQWHVDTVQFSGKTGLAVKTTSFQPQMVVIDPSNKLADAVTDAMGVIRENGTIALSKLNLTLYPDVVPDSVFYHAIHHWAAPDSMQNTTEGLRLSPYRHWELKLAGASLPEMRARFFYSNSQSHDGNLIQSEQDSVVLLYRPGAGYEWQEIPTERVGLWSIGYLIAENIQPGQYTLAVWDTQVVGQAEIPASQTKKQSLEVYPNPATDQLTFNWYEKTDGRLQVTDSSGKLVFEQQLLMQQSLQIRITNWPAGVYMADFTANGTKKVSFVKFVVQ